MKSFVLKNALRIFIIKFGIEEVNDAIAQILYEKAYDEHNLFWDDVSEAYDDINLKFFHKP
jgi:hypothetical protein